MFGWLVGCLVVFLFGWFVVWLVGCLVGCLVGWFGWLVVWLVVVCVYFSYNLLRHRSNVSYFEWFDVSVGCCC